MAELTPQDKAVTSALVIPDAAKTRLQAFWKANSRQIAAVTAGSDVDRILRVTYSVLYRNPRLIECSPFSLLNGIVLAHQLGLVFGTPEVSLVPFGHEATLIIGYNGKIKLAMMSKMITAVHTDYVLTDEEFEYEVTEQGLHFRHKPDWATRKKPDPENMLGTYCQLKTAMNGVQTRFVPLWEILQARDRSRGYQYQIKKAGTDNPWVNDFSAMALKTAVHRAMKLAPQDPRIGLASMIDDEDEGGPAVLADGLDPSAFADKDFNEPLAEISKEAQQQIVDQKTKGQKAGEKFWVKEDKPADPSAVKSDPRAPKPGLLEE